MANRYWVGGAATWDAIAGSKWALTSGGAGGQAVPTLADDVFFDGASGAVTVTTSGTTVDNARSLNFTGFTGTLSHASGTTIRIGDASGGSLTMAAGMTYTKGSTTTSAFSMLSTTTGNTITSAGKTFGNFTMNGVGGAWTFQDAFASDAAATTALTLTAGTLNTNNQTVSTGVFNSSGSGVRALNLGSSAFKTISQAQVGWNIATSTNMTLNAGTSTISIAPAAGEGGFFGGGLTYNNVVLSSANAGGSVPTTGANTYNNLTLGNSVFGQTVYFSFDSNITVTGSFTTLSTASGTRMAHVVSATETVQITITAASATLVQTNFRDIIGAGVAAPFTGSRIGDLGNNSGITFTTGITKYWVATAGGNWSATSSWSTTSGGASGTVHPLPQDTVVFDANSITTTGKTITVDVASVGQVNASGITNNPSVAPGSGYGVCLYGSWVWGTATIPFSGNLRLKGRGSQTLTFPGAWASPLTIDAPGGTWTLGGSLNVSGASSGLTLLQGTFNAATFNVDALFFNSSGALARTLSLGSGTWTFAATGTVWDTSTTTNLTVSASTGTIAVSNVTATAKTFTTGTITVNNITMSGDNITWTGATTLNTLALNNAGLTNGLKMATGTKTVSGFTNNGSVGSLTKLVSSAGGSARTISKPTGVVSVDYMSIQDSTVAGGGWYAGLNSTNVSGNTGWIFSTPPITKTQQARARLEAIVTKTQLARARLTTTVTKTQPVNARIEITATLVQTSRAYIQLVLTKTQTATARIQNGVSLTNPARARIRITGTKTQQSTSRIRKSITFTNPARGRIEKLLTKTNPARARITITGVKTQNVNARILINGVLNQTARAYIIPGVGTAVQTYRASIQKIVTLDQTSRAKIQIVPTLTQPSRARVTKTGIAKTQLSHARVQKDFTKTQLSHARMRVTGTLTQPARGRIQTTSTKTQTAHGYIQIIVTKTQTAHARIVIGGKFKYWNGSAWVKVPTSARVGGVWKSGVMKWWNGETWRPFAG